MKTSVVRKIRKHQIKVESSMLVARKQALTVSWPASWMLVDSAGLQETSSCLAKDDEL